MQLSRTTVRRLDERSAGSMPNTDLLASLSLREVTTSPISSSMALQEQTGRRMHPTDSCIKTV
jgi:hypothetical protein